jgi:predicted acylesterase/phospholipase RssA
VRCSATKLDFLTSHLFAEVDETVLDECVARSKIVTYTRGDVIVSQGGPPDAFFVIVSGRVEVVLSQPSGEEEFIEVLAAGTCVGDLALLLGEQRSATVRALVDCRVIRLLAADFQWLLETSPKFCLRLAQVVGLRLRRTTHRGRMERPTETIAICPTNDGIDVTTFCAELVEPLARDLGYQCIIRPAASEPYKGIGSHKDGPPCVLLPCDPKDQESTAGAFRNADCVLILGDPAKGPILGQLAALCRMASDYHPRPRLELVLLQHSARPYQNTRRWLQRGNFSSLHHVRTGHQDDFARLARRTMGRAIGLALSGGGARGFAHIGVIRAMEELGIPIDFIAGTSMGAIVAAQHAAGYSSDTMVEMMRQNYLNTGSLRDYALPYVAIQSGYGTKLRLQRMFGDLRIENLATPFFCVSCNLCTAETVVLESGKLWLAARSSCSVPGLLPPVRHRDGYLVDGGFLDNLPVGELRTRCRGKIVASDVSVGVELRPKPFAMGNRRAHRVLKSVLPPARMPGFGQILMRTVSLSSVRDARRAGVPADMYLRPPVDDIGMSDFARIDDIVERGMAHARVQLARWRPHEQ